MFRDLLKLMCDSNNGKRIVISITSMATMSLGVNFVHKESIEIIERHEYYVRNKELTDLKHQREILEEQKKIDKLLLKNKLIKD